MKYFWTLFMLFLLLLFPQRAYCGDKALIYHLAFDQSGENYWYIEQIPVETNQTETQKILNRFEKLFTFKAENAYAFKGGTKLLAYTLTDGILTLNLSSEITNYGGGSYLERVFIGQILATALDIPMVEKVTLMVEGDTHAFAEGTITEEVSSWQDWMEGIITN